MSRLAFLLLAACAPGADSGDSSGDGSSCGDPDGNGGDTGNIPDVLGLWTTTLGAEYWNDGCAVPNFDLSSESEWIGAFEVKGSAPSSLYAYFQDEPEERLEAAVDLRGGFTMSGLHQHEAGPLYVNFSGLVYTDNNGRTNIDGNAFLGFELTGDEIIDCYARTSWSPAKSGE